ncbi:hypothetical protein GQ55_9G587400 [Panicum hallii var. hallii]|uniref:Uncharacterized protein n=1 Tax=Panicum hallii var. hallii TaxID=1504633 RepID=A0A2T7CGP1_9POAL|nr:hypothetical protein GQ55_9G587400 [Panicum hallii var. hallii]
MESQLAPPPWPPDRSPLQCGRWRRPEPRLDGPGGCRTRRHIRRRQRRATLRWRRRRRLLRRRGGGLRRRRRGARTRARRAQLRPPPRTGGLPGLLDNQFSWQVVEQFLGKLGGGSKKSNHNFDPA